MAITYKIMKTLTRPDGDNKVRYEVFDSAGRKMIAPDWYEHEDEAFAAGQHIVKDGILYRFLVPHTAGAEWNSAEVLTVTVAEDIAAIVTSLDQKANKVSGATSGHLAGLDANGNPTDSGYFVGTGSPSDSKLWSSQTTFSHMSNFLAMKTDKVTGATENNFAALTSSGNLKDSGSKASDFLTAHQDISGKADKVTGATNGNLAGLDGNGNLTDSGYKVDSNGLAPSANTLYTSQTIMLKMYEKADKVTGATNGNLAGLDGNGNLIDSGKKASDFVEGDDFYATEMPMSSLDSTKVSEAVSGLKSAIEEISESIDFAKVTDDLSVVNEGVTFTKESNNTLKFYGTATANRRQLFLNGQSDIMVTSSAFQKTLDAGTYHIEASVTGYKTSGWYVIYSYSTFASGLYLVSYLNPTTTITFTDPVMIGTVFAVNDNWGTADNATHLTLNITKLSAIDMVARDKLNQRILPSTNDSTDRTAEINELLTKYKYVKLGVGEFHVGKITIPTGCTLEGCGEKTIIVKIATDPNIPTLMVNSKATVKDLTVKGTLTEQPTAETVIDQNRVGIAIEGVVEPVIIQNCRIIGFTYSGINIKDTGTSCKSVLISNCELIYNRTGINITNSEFANINNVICRENYIGCNNAGGNNKFAVCGFDSNGYGFIVADTPNDGHGSCVACTFNHNENKAISVQKINFGFIFDACQIHYGHVNIDDSSKGILFVGCEFGSNVILSQYTLYYPTVINSCVFYQDVRQQTGYVATNIIYNNSYLFDGTEVTNT